MRGRENGGKEAKTPNRKKWRGESRDLVVIYDRAEIDEKELERRILVAIKIICKKR